METDALKGIGELDIGLGTVLKFEPNEHQASHMVWGTQLDGSGKYKASTSSSAERRNAFPRGPIGALSAATARQSLPHGIVTTARVPGFASSQAMRALSCRTSMSISVRPKVSSEGT
jgi:hypothetical protein